MKPSIRSLAHEVRRVAGQDDEAEVPDEDERQRRDRRTSAACGRAPGTRATAPRHPSRSRDACAPSAPDGCCSHLSLPCRGLRPRRPPVTRSPRSLHSHKDWRGKPYRRCRYALTDEHRQRHGHPSPHRVRRDLRRHRARAARRRRDAAGAAALRQGPDSAAAISRSGSSPAPSRSPASPAGRSPDSLADLRGRRLVVVLGSLSTAVAGLLYFIPAGVPGLIVARLFLGAGEGAVYTAGSAWIVDMTPPERRGRIIGLYGLAIWGGLALGPPIGELILQATSFEMVWAFAAAAPLLGAAVALRIPENFVPRPGVQARTPADLARGAAPRDRPLAGDRRLRGDGGLPRPPPRRARRRPRRDRVHRLRRQRRRHAGDRRRAPRPLRLDPVHHRSRR